MKNHKPEALEGIVQLTIKWSLKGIMRFSAEKPEIIIIKRNVIVGKNVNRKS